MKTLKVIIVRSIGPVSGAVRMQYMGSGASESRARQAAFEWVNRGHNPNDEEYAEGECFDACPRLAAALADATGDARITLDWAIGSLYVRSDGTLDARYYSREDWDHALRPPLRKRILARVRRLLGLRCG